MFQVLNSSTNPGHTKVAEDHLKLIWQPLAAQDLLWNSIIKTILQLSPISLTTLLKAGIRIKKNPDKIQINIQL